GQITAPGGQITIAGVETQNLVRISAPGNVLNLEIQPIATSTTAPNNWTSAIASLPQLLTGSGDIGNATKMKVTPDGNVVLSGSGLSVPKGDGIAIASGTIDASHTTPGKTGGSVGVVGEKVAIDAAAISATGSIGGGTILIGGEYQGKGTVPTASRTYVSKDSALVADAVASGNGGKVIVWADEVTGFYGNISAKGGNGAGDGGFVEVSGKDKLAFHGQVDTSAANGKLGTLLLDPKNVTIVATGGADDNQLDANIPNPNNLPGLILSGDGGAVDFTLSKPKVESQAGNVVIEATNDITIAPGVSLNFGGPGGSSLSSIEFKADADGDFAGSFSMDTTQSIVTDASPVKISGASVTVGSINTGFYGGVGAAITLNATNGNITAGNLSSSSTNSGAKGGDITLSATGNITAGNLNSFSATTNDSNGANGGAIALNAANGIITTGAINSYSSASNNSSGNGGAIALSAKNGITIQGNLNSRAEGYGFAGSGGEIKLITSNGSITAGDLTSSSSASNSYFGDSSSSTGGNIFTTSNGSITAGSIDSSSSSVSTSNSGNATSKNGGYISIQTIDSSITTASLNSSSSSSASGIGVSSSSGDGGAITLVGATKITINGDISSYSLGGDGNGGAIDLLAADDITITTGGAIPGIYSYSSGGTGKGGPIGVTGKNITITAELITATGQIGSGNIYLTGDEINFTGATSIEGSGTLGLQPFTPSQDINIAGTDSGSTAILDLTKTELDYFQPGFTSITIGRQDGTGIITLNPYNNFNVQVIIVGGSTLVGPNQDTTWNITSKDEGNITGFPKGLTYYSIENLTGGTLNDTFIFTFTPNISGKIDGGVGFDILNYSAHTTPVTVNLATGAVNIESVIGTQYSDTIIGANTNNNWNITGSNAGNVNGTLNFSSFENLTGGTLNDTFTFSAAASISGKIDGATGFDTLDYSAINTPVTVNLATGVLNNIESVIGTQYSDTLIGANTNNNWNITGINAGNVNGTLNFSSFENLIGGTLNDTFTFSSGAIANMVVDASLGNDAIIVNGPTTLTGNVSLSTGSDGGDINFKNTLDGSGSLKLAAGTGNINFGGAVGSNARLGELIIESAGNVTTGSITASSIAQKAGTGTTTFNGTLNTNAPGGINLNGTNFALNGSAIAPNLTVQATNNITTSNITANGGINLRSSGGDINTSAGKLDSSSKNGNGGAIALAAKNNVIAGNIDSHSDNGKGGKIELQSQTGVVESGNLTSTGTAAGGDIVVKAKVSINAGQLDASSRDGDAGNVFLDPDNDIDVKFINAQGGTAGKGGNVDIITQRFFRARETFTNGNCVNASICTSGGIGAGSIRISHGGSKITPFKVGDASINGTLGVISSGNNAIALQQSFLSSYTQGNIQILTDYSPTPQLNQIVTSFIQHNQSPQTEAQTSTPGVTIDRVAGGSTSVEATLAAVEGNFTNEFTQYLGLTTQNVSSGGTQDSQNSTQANNSGGESGQSKNSAEATLNDAVNTLRKAESSTGIKPALIYIVFQPETINQPSSTTTPQATVEKKKFLSTLEEQPLWQFNSQNLPVTNQYLAQAQTPNAPKPQPNDKLQLILVTASGKPILKTIPGATREQVMAMANKLRSTITKRDENNTSYLKPAEQLYKWTVGNLETELKDRKIGNLVFVLDSGLRSLPMAALHDGKGFLIERYSIGLMPSLSLVDTRYVDIKQAQVLGMGASKFNDAGQNPLPAAQEEVSLVTSQLWKGKSFMNEDFTLARLKSERSSTPFGIIHLATHGEFKAGKPGNSYIQLWDKKLGLDEMRQLGWNNPPVQLLVLSACRTALGDAEAELGFAGLAVQAGVQTAVASLWYVSDEGSLGLMTDFYRQLKKSPTKAEALRRAQLALLKGEVRLEGGKLHGSGENFSLPPELVQLGDKNLSHPYYWAAFTMIGSPW
ncbi:CHAT domain-containing protein, partial [Microcoleus sp. FACHB-831]|uniref:CHAT domain-containing protein n=1 Tax=Microcoleus sp. FACHB-831 TaxID=2692827 RepID=UPI00168A2D5B